MINYWTEQSLFPPNKEDDWYRYSWPRVIDQQQTYNIFKSVTDKDPPSLLNLACQAILRE